MLVSSILGPGTIFLMTIGAISISFDSDIYVSFLVCLTPVAIFAVICMTCSGDTQVGLEGHSNHDTRVCVQLIAAQVVAALFTLLMTAVIVGTALQIKKDGLYSPHAIFLFAVMGR
jgi:chitin synthase